MEFDAKYTLSKDFFAWYFYESLRLLIKLWIDKEKQELDNWKQLIKKSIRVKTKTNIQLASSRDVDQCYYRRNWLMHASLNKAIKDFKIRESKPKT